MSLITDHHQYAIRSVDDNTILLLDWKPAPGLPATDFAGGITRFAQECSTRHPERAVIDARQLDQTSQAIGWLRDQDNIADLAPYQTWWEREIIPLYNTGNITALTVATGDPDAPGEIATPEAAHFRMGYFTDLDTAQSWTPAT